MTKYYKLNLEGNVFWQSERKSSSKTYTLKPYERRNDEVLNSIFFKNISDSELVEITTGFKVSIDSNGLPIINGAIISEDTFSTIDFQEAFNAYNEIKKLSLNAKYYHILKDLLVNSNLCAKAQEKKEENMRLMLEK